VHSQIYPLASPFPDILTLNMVLIPHSQLRSVGMPVEGGNHKKKCQTAAKRVPVSVNKKVTRILSQILNAIVESTPLVPPSAHGASARLRPQYGWWNTVSSLGAPEWWGREGQHSSKLPATRLFF